MNSTPTGLVIRRSAELADLTRRWQLEGESIGIVPTMGALHEGHLSLIRAGRREVDRLVVTIFVNPTQFGPQEDLQSYPRVLDQDLNCLQPLGVDAVFAPDQDELYPPGFSTFIDPPDVAERWEGAVRPTHFRGVTTIVLKLLLLSRAEHAFFGQKDFQQSVVVRRMIRDLNIPCRLHVLPTVREADGLAMSSRNRYLSQSERVIAAGLYRTLRAAAAAIDSGEHDARAVGGEMIQWLIDAGFDTVDYAAVCDPENLRPVDHIQSPVVLLVAARLGSTRLIDNWLVGRS